MCEGYEEDLDMYEKAEWSPRRQLDNETLLCPISTLSYLKTPPLVGPDTQVSEALKTMIQKGAGAVLVVEHGKVAGIFSGRDALMKCLSREKYSDRPVRPFMTPDPDPMIPSLLR